MKKENRKAFSISEFLADESDIKAYLVRKDFVSEGIALPSNPDKDSIQFKVTYDKKTGKLRAIHPAE